MYLISFYTLVYELELSTLTHEIRGIRLLRIQIFYCILSINLQRTLVLLDKVKCFINFKLISTREVDFSVKYFFMMEISQSLHRKHLYENGQTVGREKCC